MTESFAGNGLEHLIHAASLGETKATAWPAIRQLFFSGMSDSEARKAVVERGKECNVWVSFRWQPECEFIYFQPFPDRGAEGRS